MKNTHLLLKKHDRSSSSGASLRPFLSPRKFAGARESNPGANISGVSQFAFYPPPPRSVPSCQLADAMASQFSGQICLRYRGTLLTLGTYSRLMYLPSGAFFTLSICGIIWRAAVNLVMRPVPAHTIVGKRGIEPRHNAMHGTSEKIKTEDFN